MRAQRCLTRIMHCNILGVPHFASTEGDRLIARTEDTFDPQCRRTGRTVTAASASLTYRSRGSVRSRSIEPQQGWWHAAKHKKANQGPPSAIGPSGQRPKPCGCPESVVSDGRYTAAFAPGCHGVHWRRRVGARESHWSPYSWIRSICACSPSWSGVAKYRSTQNASKTSTRASTLQLGYGTTSARV